MPSKIIVTTTINAPTEAIKKFDLLPDWHLIVAGDKKTPSDYRLKFGLYLSPDDQVAYDPALSEAIGWNCMQRRNFAILTAYDLGAEVIAVVDDDNIPLLGWGQDLMVDRMVEVRYDDTDELVFDPVGLATGLKLWHRGFPLQLLQGRTLVTCPKRVCRPIQADFWNGDPDIDAICRMEHAPECAFNPIHFPMASNAFSPFNSQNTFLSRSVIPNYFLFPGIGRMDDIWASYYVESLGMFPVYGKASVYQERNAHDLTKDMCQEFLGYEHNLQLVKDLRFGPQNIFRYLPSRSMRMFRLYRRHFQNA